MSKFGDTPEDAHDRGQKDGSDAGALDRYVHGTLYGHNDDDKRDLDEVDEAYHAGFKNGVDNPKKD